MWLSDADVVLGEIEEFLTGVRHTVEPDRVLATVLFTDIVGATEKASALGDRRWRDLLDGHNVLVRRELARFRGRESRQPAMGFSPPSTVNGLSAAPARCRGDPVALDSRSAGIHTAECEIIGDDMGGYPRALGTLARKATTGESRHRFGGPPEMPAQMTASV